MIVFEYPLNERIRTWLRIEDLFDKAGFFIRANDARSHHAGLLAIFELVDVMTRPELRSEVIQELDRQRATLETYRGNPGVDQHRLAAIVNELSNALTELHGVTGKLGQHIRDNDWLAAIKSRTGIPGGTCGFDLPGYYFWLNADPGERAVDLHAWLAPLLPIKAGVGVILRLLRESGGMSRQLAGSGLYQLMLGGRVAHLLRVAIEDDRRCVPEVSANKYAVNLRFVSVEKSQKPRTLDQDIPFELGFCSLSGCCG